jgi:hypothetical protein
MSKVNKTKLAKDYVLQDSQEIEDKSKQIISWGKNNLYPQWLNFMFYTCAVHQGIINGKVFFTTAGGLKYNPQSEPTIKMIEKHLPTAARSLEICDAYYFKCSLDFQTKSKIEQVELIPFEWVRVGIEKGHYMISEDWSDNKIPIKTLTTHNLMTDSDHQFIYAFQVQPQQYLMKGKGKGSKLSLNYYPMPSYSGAILSILTDIEAVEYQFNSFINSFSIGTILQFNNGTPQTDDDRRDVEDRVSKDATGADNTSGVAIFYGNGKDTAPTVLQLSGDQLHERYTQISKDVRENIAIGHSVTSLELFAFAKDGSFNSSNLEVAYQMMKQNYFKARQEQLLYFIDFVNKFNGISDEVSFNDYALLGVADVTNATGEKLNSMSPLVANSVIKSMTTNEIRALAGLLPIEGGDVIANDIPEAFNKQSFNAEPLILGAFANCGRDKGTFEILMSEPKNDEPFKELFKGKFVAVSETQVLALISDGNTFDKIAKALELKLSELTKVYKRLVDKGHLTAKGQVTSAGKIAIIESDIDRMEILYSYELKPNAPALVPGGKSRPFCEEMMTLNRLYTREEIDRISQQFDMDVWRYRGGWYHNPDTGVNTPSCRHVWNQNLIFVNK